MRITCLCLYFSLLACLLAAYFIFQDWLFYISPGSYFVHYDYCHFSWLRFGVYTSKNSARSYISYLLYIYLLGSVVYINVLFSIATTIYICKSIYVSLSLFEFIRLYIYIFPNITTVIYLYIYIYVLYLSLYLYIYIYLLSQPSLIYILT